MAGDWMAGFVSGTDRNQGTMFPAQLEDYVAEDNPVRVIDLFVDQLDLGELGFGGVNPKEMGRPAYHPAVLLKIYDPFALAVLRPPHISRTGQLRLDCDQAAAVAGFR
jgi:hypothetical protein